MHLIFRGIIQLFILSGMISLILFPTYIAYGEGSDDFIITIDTTKSGISGNNEFEIPTNGTNYNYNVDWGDGIIETAITGKIRHSFVSEGVYEIRISGDFPRIFFNGDTDKEKLLDIKQWGNIEWKDMYGAFKGCINLTGSFTDVPNLTQVESLNSAFSGAHLFNGDISLWDVSNVEIMNSTFRNAKTFNGDISGWDVSNVTSMSSMFYGASTFNQNLEDWDTQNVELMGSLFRDATAFDGKIGTWNTMNVRKMQYMFYKAVNFDQDIGLWNTSSVIDMSNMFREAKKFNQNIGGWNTSAVKNMSQMFRSASEFDQNISSWDFSQVTNMTNFLLDAKFSITNYEFLLIRLNNQLPDVTAFHGGSSYYCSLAADTARQNLITTGWSVNDAGRKCGPIDITHSTNGSITENTTVAGSLTAVDDDLNIPNPTDSHVFVFVPGSGDEDNNKFTLTSAGILTFNSAPDFENPTDNNTDNVYNIRVKVTDSTGNEFIKSLSVTVTDLDEIDPVLTLSGSTPVTIELGSTYTDAGATCVDNVSCVVIDVSTVNSSEVGTYSVTYTAVDPSGNDTTLVRTVNVVDTIAPVLTLSGSTPVTIELGTTYTDAGATCVDNVSCVVTDVSTVNSSEVGTYSVTYNAVDPSGNDVAAVRAVNVVDTIAPVLTLSGSTPLTVELGSTYTDAGATCADNDSCVVTEVSTLDSSVVGTYSITYTAVDPSGNETTSDREVIVIYKTKTITSGTTYSQSSHDTGIHEIPIEINVENQESPKVTGTSELVETENEIEKIINPNTVSKQEISKRLKAHSSCQTIDLINNPALSDSKFNDINFSNYKPSIESLEYAGVVDGITPNFFGVDQSITRAEFLKITLRTYCIDYTNEETSDLEYIDINKSTWVAKVISKSLEEGLIDMTADKKFRPNDPISKIEAIKILVNMTFADFDEELVSSYDDIPDGHWSDKYIAQGEQIGLYSSVETNHLFYPNNTVNRDNMSYFVEKMVNIYDNNKELITGSDY